MLIDVSFTDGAAAVAYFTGHAVNLGAINGGGPDDLDPTFKREITVPHYPDAFVFDLLFRNAGAVIPEPGTAIMVARVVCSASRSVAGKPDLASTRRVLLALLVTEQ